MLLESGARNRPAWNPARELALMDEAFVTLAKLKPATTPMPMEWCGAGLGFVSVGGCMVGCWAQRAKGTRSGRRRVYFFIRLKLLCRRPAVNRTKVIS